LSDPRDLGHDCLHRPPERFSAERYTRGCDRIAAGVNPSFTIYSENGNAGGNGPTGVNERSLEMLAYLLLLLLIIAIFDLKVKVAIERK
jgi:hypothetical protein